MNLQLYDNVNYNAAWSDVSTLIISVLKSGPRLICIVLIYPTILGHLPDKLVTVNVSSGYNYTKLGPNTILLYLDL